MATEKFTFQADVGKLLDIVARSLYSHKEVFLRELISNASDACDRLRYAALTEPDLLTGGAFKIILSADKKARTLTIADNGIGMDHKELEELLGTIARSGSQAFMDSLGGDDTEKEMALIGQFGVGFYASFMVADKVEVLTRRAGADEAWLWASDGGGEFTITEAKRDGPGTSVTLTLSKKEDEFLDRARLGHIVRTYSDHVGLPIVFKDGETEQSLNTGSALWTRPKKDITDDQYKEFYHHVGNAFDDPWAILHNRIEGVLSYISLLFIPGAPPFDLFDPARKSKVKLYVNRVFITDDCEGLVPGYLRFLRGIVDTEDLSLNISREMLQQDPKLAKIRSGLVKRVLGELKKKAEKKPELYAEFWKDFGPVLKEGLYDDTPNRDRILGLSRFYSTAGNELVSLDDYVGRMKEGQDAIYTISGSDLDQLRMSPQLEGFKSRGVEVLLLVDPVDEFWMPVVGAYQEKPFKSATRAGADLDKVAAPDEKKKSKKKKPPAGMEALLAVFKEALGEAVKDVTASDRLTDSPVCLSAGEGDMDINLERMLKQHRQLDEATPRILQVNPDHPLIRRLAAVASGDSGGSNGADLADAAHLLLDQARILEGEPVPDPAAFSRRLSAMVEKGLAG